MVGINDYYLVYNSSRQQYQIWSVTVGDTVDAEDGPASYTSYNVLDNVSEETAESLGLSFSSSSSTQDKEFKNNVSVDKNLNVSGDSTVTGNESVTGKSTVGSQELTRNAETK